jgi:hypothetical protein
MAVCRSAFQQQFSPSAFGNLIQVLTLSLELRPAARKKVFSQLHHHEIIDEATLVEVDPLADQGLVYPAVDANNPIGR